MARSSAPGRAVSRHHAASAVQLPPAPCPALTYIVKAPSLALAWETPGFWKEQAMAPPVTEGFPPTPPPISLYGPVRPSPLTQRPGLQTRGPGPWASPTQALQGVGSETVGEMLCRAQLIGPGVRSALGGPMEEVSIQEALARGEGSSLLMWKAGAGDNDVLNARERLP